MSSVSKDDSCLFPQALGLFFSLALSFLVINELVHLCLIRKQIFFSDLELIRIKTCLFRYLGRILF